MHGIGVGVCELVNLAGEVVSANCVAWQGLPVRERFATVAPCWVEADVRAAAFIHNHAVLAREPVGDARHGDAQRVGERVVLVGPGREVVIGEDERHHDPVGDDQRR
ncbi:MAG: hypothetical protein HC863_03095, partial [Myxococcales bacterium]|nr:hypothetical protein [Myxococcales bacterium]